MAVLGLDVHVTGRCPATLVQVFLELTVAGSKFQAHEISDLEASIQVLQRSGV